MKHVWKKAIGILLVLALVLQPLPITLRAAEETAGDATVAKVVEAPVFSHESGNYDDAFELTLSAEEGTTIYYSTDGSDPTPKDGAGSSSSSQIFEYENEISIHDRTGEPNVLATAANSEKFAQLKKYNATDEQVAKSTVIRAVAVDEEGNCSRIATQTYFVGTNQTKRYSGVPVFSLVTDPENLTDDEKGIFVAGNHKDYLNYEQHGKEWEREAYVDFYDTDGEVDFSENIGIRVHGGYTRQFQQKSLNVYFREEYGSKNLKYELIPGATNYEGTAKTKKYKNFMLRTGGNDALLTKMRDVFIQSLVEDRAMSVQSSRPCVVYLNGEYWGVYNIQEKYSDNWLEEEFGVDKNNIMIIKNGEVDEGVDEDIEYFHELSALADLDMSQPENYQKFLDAVDLQSFLDYYATEILIGNNDWGWEQNAQCWRSREVTENKYEDGKWRWMLYDTEYSMNLYSQASGDTIAKMSNVGETSENALFVSLLQNTEFQQAFKNTAMDLLNENFNQTKQRAKYEAMKSVYETLMVEQNRRFGNDWGYDNMDAFNASISQFEEAWAKMPSRVEEMLNKYCNGAATTPTPSNPSVTPDTSDPSVTPGTTDPTVTLGTSDSAATPGISDSTAVPGASDPVMKPEDSTPTATPGAAVSEQDEKDEDDDADDEEEEEIEAPKKAVIQKLTSPKKKTIKLRLKKTGGDGFEIVYASNKKFTKSKKQLRTKKTTVTIKKLKSQKTYYVKVRAYRMKKDGTRVYGKFSKIKRIRVK